MRRAVSSVTVALGLLGVTVALPGVALAAQVPASTTAAVTPGKKRCTIDDERLRELSGLVATKSGYIVINDGSELESRKRVFFLDAKCKIAKEPVRYSGQGPLDTEDLALSPDGKTLWIADTGDNVSNKQRRERVAVWTMPVSGSKQPVLHRLAYPQKAPHDAEALLIGADGKPLIITKVPAGKAEIFTTAAALKTGDTEPVPMKNVGEITLPKTNTDNRMGLLGRVAITGAAASPDGSKVVLRTYADAFEYDVSGGDIVTALTTGKPRVTPLTDPFGEAISYTPDGKGFVTVSDGGLMAADEPIDILAYTPSTSGAEALATGADTKKAAAEKSWVDGLSLADITYLIAAVGVVGALMVGAGIFGILRARRRPAPADARDGLERDDEFGLGFDDRVPGRPEGGLPPGGDRPGGGVYGGGPAGGGGYGAPPPGGGAPGRPPAGAAPGRPAAAPSGGVYGGGRPSGGGGGGVYGGGRPAGGGVYGGGGQPGGDQPRGDQPGRGGQPRGGGGVYGGGRAEPPRRGEPDYREPRAGRRRDNGYDDGPGGPYGQVPGGGRDHRGERY